MKQHNIHNDEALYQQLLAELTPAAEEYDRIMEQGQQPACRSRRGVSLYRYIAAACVLIAIVGGTLALQTKCDETIEPYAVDVVPAQPDRKVALAPILKQIEENVGNNLTEESTKTMAEVHVTQKEQRITSETADTEQNTPSESEDFTDEIQLHYLQVLSENYQQTMPEEDMPPEFYALCAYAAERTEALSDELVGQGSDEAPNKTKATNKYDHF